MSDSVTVVISAAGLGSRLGLNKPKALVEVGGTPILARQLDQLSDHEDVVVVVGYQAASVISLVRDVRPDVVIALNHEYASTGTAASLGKGAALAGPWLVSLDGDLLVAGQDLRRVIGHAGPCLGLTAVTSSAPVYALTDEVGTVLALSQETQLAPQETSRVREWSGLAKISRLTAMGLGTGHVFHGLLRHLPTPGVPVDCIEVDDLDDLESAEVWVAHHGG